MLFRSDQRGADLQADVASYGGALDMNREKRKKDTPDSPTDYAGLLEGIES